MLIHFSHVQLYTIPWTIACQIPLTMGFSRQEVGYHVLLQGFLLTGTEPMSLVSLALKSTFLPLAPPRKPLRKWYLLTKISKIFSLIII